MELVLLHVGGVTLHKTVLAGRQNCTVSGLDCTGSKREMWRGLTGGMSIEAVVRIIIVSSSSNSNSSNSITTRYGSTVRWSGTICSLTKGRHWHCPLFWCQCPITPHCFNRACCAVLGTTWWPGWNCN
jgi:hypothetical protein